MEQGWQTVIKVFAEIDFLKKMHCAFDQTYMIIRYTYIDLMVLIVLRLCFWAHTIDLRVVRDRLVSPDIQCVCSFKKDYFC